MNVSTDTKAVLQYQAGAKSLGVAYLLWFFLGAWGGHRFYAGKKGSAIVMIVIMLISIPFCLILIGYFGVGVVVLWALIDAFLIPGWIKEHNAKLVTSLTG